MKFLLMSDLHMEAGAKGFRPDPIADEKDVNLFLAGDICEIDKLNTIIPFLIDMSVRFKNVVYVPGNHEFYHGHIHLAVDKLKNAINDAKDNMNNYLYNVHFLNNDSVNIDGYNVIGSTLWTNMNNHNPMAMWDAENGLNDYRLIKISGYRKLRAVDTYNEHVKCIRYLEKKLSDLAGQKNIVITHHAPSHLSIAPEYIGDRLNPAYISELSEFVDKHKPILWCHGHVHNSFDYMLYDTRVLCNPRGYFFGKHPENQAFSMEPSEI